MDRTTKEPGKARIDPGWGVPIAAGITAGPIEAADAALHAADLITGTRQDVPWNPISFALGLETGAVHWDLAATCTAATVGVLATATGVAVARRFRRGKGKRLPIDEQAKWMGRGEGIAALTGRACAEKAVALRVQLPDWAGPGVPIGLAVQGRAELFGSYEDLHLDIWGPRQGKSTSRVIPAVMTAPGAVVTTSNKRDVVDATRDHRAGLGRVWVFDPQGVAEEPCAWFWNPLAWVLGDGSTAKAEIRAITLAAHFADGEGGQEAKQDSFFDPEGEDLLAALFLAAALDHRPITQAYRWVTREMDTEPVGILQRHGYDILAHGLSAQYQSPPKQRGGIFGTAKKMARCLKISSTQPWVCPGGGREEFTVDQLVRGADTLYSLSLEGAGAAGPLVTALAAAVCDAGVQAATRSPGGRLPTPLLAVLDEAANVVRWRELPKLYSHFGSRGIVVMTVLQSWAQGVRCWGHEGMSALWSAANIKVLGSGLDDAAFLRDRSEIVGEHYELAYSTSTNAGGRSTNTTRQTVRTLTVSDLAAMPRGRAVVFASGMRPVLVETVPWMARPWAPLVHASLANHDPARPQLRAVPNPATDNREDDVA